MKIKFEVDISKINYWKTVLLVTYNALNGEKLKVYFMFLERA